MPINQFPLPSKDFKNLWVKSKYLCEKKLFCLAKYFHNADNLYDTLYCFKFWPES